MLRDLGIALGGLALAAYGSWLLFSPGYLVRMERRRVERYKSSWLIPDWHRRYVQSGQYEVTIRITGGGAVLMGGLLIAIATGSLNLR